MKKPIAMTFLVALTGTQATLLGAPPLSCGTAVWGSKTDAFSNVEGAIELALRMFLAGQF